MEKKTEVVAEECRKCIHLKTFKMSDGISRTNACGTAKNSIHTSTHIENCKYFKKKED